MRFNSETIFVISFTVLFSFSLYSPITGFAQESPEGWERLSDMPETRSEMKSVAVDDKIYVIGGLNNREFATNTIFIFDTKDNSWSTGPYVRIFTSFRSSIP